MRYRLEQDPVPGPDAAPRPHLRFRRWGLAAFVLRMSSTPSATRPAVHSSRQIDRGNRREPSASTACSVVPVLTKRVMVLVTGVVSSIVDCPRHQRVGTGQRSPIRRASRHKVRRTSGLIFPRRSRDGYPSRSRSKARHSSAQMTSDRQA